VFFSFPKNSIVAHRDLGWPSASCSFCRVPRLSKLNRLGCASIARVRLARVSSSVLLRASLGRALAESKLAIVEMTRIMRGNGFASSV
jgi:hypothetical protein